MNRRRFLSIVVTGIGASMAAVMAIPAVLHSFSPLFRDENLEDWRPLGPLENFPMGKIVPATVKISEEFSSMNQKGVFVWRKDFQSFVIYSRSCTDLGCPLTYDPGSEWFFCPCHGGIFDKDGERRAGPPNKPMWRYAFRVKENILEIDLRSVPPMV